MAKVKHKAVGVELDSTEWADADTHELIDGAEGDIIPSFPPSGYYKVTNIYVEKVGETYKLRVEHSDEPEL